MKERGEEGSGVGGGVESRKRREDMR